MFNLFELFLLINSCNSNSVSCSVTNSIQIMKRDSITFFNQSFSLHLVYPQSLVVNSAARRTCTVGEIVNLVSADTQKLMDFVVYFNAVWLAPIEVTLCLFFLWQVRWYCICVFSFHSINYLHSSNISKVWIGYWLNSCFSFPREINKTCLISAFRTISSSGHRHRDLHLPSEWIHCKEEKQTPGTVML